MWPHDGAAQIPDGYSMYSGHQEQFTLALPEGWIAYDQRKHLAGLGTNADDGLGVIIFSPVDLAAMAGPFPAGQQPDVQALLDTMGKIDTGELPSFFVERSRSERGMSCASLGDKGIKGIQKRVHESEFGHGTKTIEPLRADSIAVGGCQGIHIHGRVITRTAGEWVVDVHAASDGQFLYLFSLRHSATYFEANLPPYMTGLATLRLAAAVPSQ
jgi:hypothetical protein